MNLQLSRLLFAVAFLLESVGAQMVIDVDGAATDRKFYLIVANANQDEMKKVRLELPKAWQSGAVSEIYSGDQITVKDGVIDDVFEGCYGVKVYEVRQ